jgi:hypothetical protein
MESNDEIRMMNDEESPNDEFQIRMSILDQLVVIRALSLIRHSDFVIYRDDGQWRHCDELLFEGGKCCKSRDGSAWTACNSSS